MSHFDGESSQLAALAGLAESCAARARGIAPTKAKAKAQLTILETREDMRFSSATDLNGESIMLFRAREWLGLTRIRTTNRTEKCHYSTIKRTIGEIRKNIFFSKKQYPVVQRLQKVIVT